MFEHFTSVNTSPFLSGIKTTDQAIEEQAEIPESEDLSKHKGIEFLPQTKIFKSLYLCNLTACNFDISDLFYLTEFII